MTNDLRFTTQIRPEEMEELLAEAKKDDPRATSPPRDDGVEPDRQPIEVTKRFRPASRPAIAQLLVFYDDQKHFDSVRMTADRTVIGRETGDVIIDYDPLVSARHAEIVREHFEDGYRWVLRDLDSTNGVFVCVDRARLKDGDQLLIGSERYGFHVDGGQACLGLLGEKSQGQEIELPSDGFCVGREQHELLDAFWDERLDPKHAFFQPDKTGTWIVKNLQSVNGIWYRITELPLFRRCYFQLGEQRFGFRY